VYTVLSVYMTLRFVCTADYVGWWRKPGIPVCRQHNTAHSVSSQSEEMSVLHLDTSISDKDL